MTIQTKTMTVKSDTALAETTTTIRDTVTFDVSKMPNGITYKGLKAVLSFADPIQWNRASTYDALTVVWDDATHASYASKRRVPANIELTNEFYWFRTADLDAQVEMYRQEVMEFDGRITENAQAIAATDIRVTTMNDKISAIQGVVNNGTRKLLWIGDSFSADIHAQEWSPVTMLQKRGWDIDNQAFDGAGFVGVTAASHKTFIKQLQAPADKTVYTDVVVYGGNNDQEITISAVVNAIKDFAKYFNANYPNANLWFFTDNTPNINYETRLYQYIYAMETTCKRVRIFSNVNAVQLCTGGYQSSTNMHPSLDCGSYLADYFNKILNGAQQNLNYMINPKDNIIATDCFLTSDLSGLYIPNFMLITSESDTIANATELFKIPFMIPSQYKNALISQQIGVNAPAACIQFVRQLDPSTKLYTLSAQYFGPTISGKKGLYFGPCSMKWRNIR